VGKAGSLDIAEGALTFFLFFNMVLYPARESDGKATKAVPASLLTDVVVAAQKLSRRTKGLASLLSLDTVVLLRVFACFQRCFARVCPRSAVTICLGTARRVRAHTRLRSALSTLVLL
jgi:hypothetical protein